MKNNPSTVRVTWSPLLLPLVLCPMSFFPLSLSFAITETHKVHSILLLLSSMFLKKRIFVSELASDVTTCFYLFRPLSPSPFFLISLLTQLNTQVVLLFSPLAVLARWLNFLPTQVNLKDFNNELQSRRNCLLCLCLSSSCAVVFL